MKLRFLRLRQSHFYTVQIELDGFTASSDRYKKLPEAEAVSKNCTVAVVTNAECKEKSEKPPALL